MNRVNFKEAGAAFMQVLGLKMPESVGGPTQPIAEAFGNGKFGLRTAHNYVQEMERKTNAEPGSLISKFEAALERLPYEKSRGGI